MASNSHSSTTDFPTKSPWEKFLLEINSISWVATACCWESASTTVLKRKKAANIQFSEDNFKLHHEIVFRIWKQQQNYKKDTKITVHAKTYVKSNVGGALLFGGFFPRTDFCLKNKLSLSLVFLGNYKLEHFSLKFYETDKGVK